MIERFQFSNGSAVGSNRLYKENEVLFHEGDESDGMYLVRSGELKIYLDKDGNEIQLATVGPGGMIGEMAFFEDKPRSASVKALKASEVTKISNQDFEKLIKQIPKWFVTLMSGLSGRLRITNERLQNLENSASGTSGRYERLKQIFHILELMVHKHGFKDNKELNLSREKAEEELQLIFQIDKKTASRFIAAIAQSNVIGLKKDSYNNDVLNFKSSGAIREFTDFIEDFKKEYPHLTYLPDDAVKILEYAYEFAKDSPYEKATVPFLELVHLAEKDLINTLEWRDQLKHFKSPKPFLQLVKTGPGAMGFRVVRKELRSYVKKLKILTEFHKAGLDR